MGGACGKGGDAPSALKLEVGPHAIGRALTGKELIVHHGWNDAVIPIPDTWVAFTRLSPTNLAKCLHSLQKARNKAPHDILWVDVYDPNNVTSGGDGTFDAASFLGQLGLSEYHQRCHDFYAPRGGWELMVSKDMSDADLESIGVKPAHRAKLKKGISMYRKQLGGGHGKKKKKTGPQAADVAGDADSHTAYDELASLLALPFIRTPKDEVPEDAGEDLKHIAIFCAKFRPQLLEDAKLNLLQKISIVPEQLLGGAMDDKHLKKLFHVFEEVDSWNNGEFTNVEFEAWMMKKADHLGASVLISAICADYDAGPQPGFIQLQEFILLVEHVCLMTEGELVHYAFNELQHGQDEPESQYVRLDSFNDRFRHFHHVDEDINVDLLNHLQIARAKLATAADLRQGLSDEAVNFNMFAAMHKKYPSVLFPLIWAQKHLRKCTFGNDWWVERRKTMGTDADVNAMHSDRLELLATKSAEDHRLNYMAEQAAVEGAGKKPKKAAKEPDDRTTGTAVRRKPKHVKHFTEHDLSGHVDEAHVESHADVALEEHHHRKKKKKHRREAEDLDE